jgi:anti-sigma regulatory factor (Ser/Thr protein kinase)
MSRTSVWSYHKAWPCHVENVAEARAFVSVHLVDGGLPIIVEYAQLVVSELATNAVVHARTPFGVTISRYDGVVEIAVGDDDSFEPAVPSADVQDQNGRGLRLVELCSNSWGVTAPSSGGKSVWARFKIASF